jgi:hypothetical protein
MNIFGLHWNFQGSNEIENKTAITKTQTKTNIMNITSVSYYKKNITP